MIPTPRGYLHPTIRKPRASGDDPGITVYYSQENR